MIRLIFEWAEDIPWMREGNCREVGSEFMYPEPMAQPTSPRSKDYVYTEEEKFAKEVCGDCEVRANCLEFALKRKEKYGVWGGLTEVQRADLVQLYKNRPFERIIRHAQSVSDSESTEGKSKGRKRYSRPA